MKKLSEMNVGLVLSGGGAKGAYQIGMLRALEELGISRQISVISGTSIGAFNALAYAVGGTEKMRDIMTHFFACYERGMDNDEATLARAKENVLAGRAGMEEFISDPAYRRSDSAPLAEYMRASLPDALLADYKLRVLACAYSLEDARPQYFTLNGLPGEAQRQLVLASGSLAFVYPPIAYGGRHYLDGGEIPEICPNGAPEDKIPLRPIADAGLDAIIVSFLIASDTVDTALVPPGTGYHELRPSVPLEAYPGAGTLDFSPEKLASHEALGYADTLRHFAQHAL